MRRAIACRRRGPDRRLLQLAAAFLAIEVKCTALWMKRYASNHSPETSFEQEEFAWRTARYRNSLIDTVASLPAHTAEGHTAKARMLRAYYSSIDNDGRETTEANSEEEALTLSLANDLLVAS